MPPPAAALKGSGAKVHSIGVISTNFPGNEMLHNPYTVGLLKGIMTVANDRRCNVTVFTPMWSDDVDDPEVFDTPVDGFVVIAPDVGTKLIPAMQARGIPMVATSANPVDAGVPAIDADGERGAELATAHLIELGHKRIAHLAGTLTQGDGITRKDTFLRVMKEHGLDVGEDFVPETGFSAVNAYNDATRLLSRPDRPTAIFAATDYIAYWVVLAARDLGIEIPRQLSVVGYDDAPIAMETEPSVTTVRQPLEEMGRRATSMLLDIISGSAPKLTPNLLPAELVVRNSTGPAPRE